MNSLKFHVLKCRFENFVFTVFSVNLRVSDATDEKKYGHIRHQRLKINMIRNFVFRFTQIFILTVIFTILVGHIELKKLTENAGLQSHTMPIAEEHYMSI